LFLIRFFALLVEFLLALLFVRLVFGWLGSALRSLGAGRGMGKPAVRPSQDLVRDRICNTFLPRQSAVVATVGGEPQYFCSSACRDKAVAAVRAAS
jgi:hypothetical protein